MLERFPDSSTNMLTQFSFILKRHERQVSPSLKAKNFPRFSVTPAICLRRRTVYQIGRRGARGYAKKVFEGRGMRDEGMPCFIGF